MITGLNQCHFCGKEDFEVRTLVVGPMVTICDDCIFMSVHILRTEYKLQEPEDHPNTKDQVYFRTQLALNEVESYRRKSGTFDPSLSNAVVSLREAELLLKKKGALAVLGNAKISR